MTTRRWLLLFVAVTASVLAVAAVVWCAESKQDEKVSLDQVPAAVKATIVKAAEGGTIGEIEKATKHGKTVYEADVLIGGQELEVRVAPDGTLLSKAADDEAAEKTEEKVTLDQVPAAVKATITKAAEGGTVGEIEKVTKDGKTVYEADVLIGDEKFEVRVGPGGKLLSKKVDDEGDGENEGTENHEANDGGATLTLDQVPAAVKATIVEAAAGGTVGEIEKETKGDKTVYEADIVVDGKKLEVRVAPDGKLLSKKADEEDDDD